MTPILIDPPVGPHSEPGAIREWIAELERKREAHADDPDAVRLIDLEHDRAREWLGQRPQ